MFRKAVREGLFNEDEISINTKKFINSIKERPPIYDKSHPQYNNRTAKNELWCEVGEIQFSKRWPKWNQMERRTAVCYMQKRWGNLRTTFAREVKKHLKRKELGMEGDKWIHYDIMLFMKNFMNVIIDGVTVSTSDVLDEEEPTDEITAAEHIKAEYSSEEDEGQYLEEEHLDISEDKDNSNDEECLLKTENKPTDSELSEDDIDNESPKPTYIKVSSKLNKPNLKRNKNSPIECFVDVNDDIKKSKGMKRKCSASESSTMPPGTPTQDVNVLDNDVNFALSLVPFLKQVPSSVKLEAQIDILSILKKYSAEN